MKWLALVFLVGCVEAPVEMSEYDCPPTGTQLTFANFGSQFLNANCNTCHSSTAGHRHGAPESYAFDTIEGVHAHRDRIFVRAAASNVSMPPGPVDPSPEEREQLAEWLACGAP
ncbi:MAG: hypothetical protein ABI175_24610 [Polyangiales bacterium]